MPAITPRAATPVTPSCDAVPNNWDTASALLTRISEGANSGKLGTNQFWVGTSMEMNPLWRQVPPNELLAAVARGQAASIDEVTKKGTWGRRDLTTNVFEQPTQQTPSAEINLRALIDALKLKLHE